MNAERFEALAMAYGGDLRRWPAGEREAAAALLAASPGLAAMLEEADGLDVALDAWRAPVVGHELRDRILAAAPRPRRRFGRFGVWLSGAGFAAAAVAGVVVGVAVCSAAVSDARADGLLSAALSNEATSGVTAFTLGLAGALQA